MVSLTFFTVALRASTRSIARLPRVEACTVRLSKIGAVTVWPATVMRIWATSEWPPSYTSASPTSPPDFFTGPNPVCNTNNVLAAGL